MTPTVFSISDAASVQLYRYEDAVLGPRTIPKVDDILAGKIEIPSDAVFGLNVEANTIELNVGGAKHPTGHDLLYVIKQ